MIKYYVVMVSSASGMRVDLLGKDAYEAKAKRLGFADQEWLDLGIYRVAKSDFNYNEHYHREIVSFLKRNKENSLFEGEMTIKAARKQVGLSQQELSDWLEIPKRTIEDWESGKRIPPRYVEKLVIEKILSR